MRALPFFLACLASTSLAACNVALGSSTQGSQGKVTFSYSACLFGCTVGDPMMLGTDEGISVHGSSIPAVTVQSSDGTVLSVEDATRTCCDANNTCNTIGASTECASGEHADGLGVRVRALAAGTATLELVASDGSTYDSVPLEVAPPTALAVTCGSATGSIALRVNGSCAAGWTAKDAKGRELRATTGVTLTSADASIVAFQQLLGGPIGSVVANQGLLGTTIVGVAAGDTTITASAGNATTSVAAHVTP